MLILTSGSKNTAVPNPMKKPRRTWRKKRRNAIGVVKSRL
jgi:hypothetical protein